MCYGQEAWHINKSSFKLQILLLVFNPHYSVTILLFKYLLNSTTSALPSVMCPETSTHVLGYANNLLGLNHCPFLPGLLEQPPCCCPCLSLFPCNSFSSWLQDYHVTPVLEILCGFLEILCGSQCPHI